MYGKIRVQTRKYVKKRYIACNVDFFYIKDYNILIQTSKAWGRLVANSTSAP
jgi:hypothetical protein